MVEGKNKSKPWLYFTKKDDNIASCNVCKMIISSKGGNTSIMLKHYALLDLNSRNAMYFTL